MTTETAITDRGASTGAQCGDAFTFSHMTNLPEFEGMTVYCQGEPRHWEDHWSKGAIGTKRYVATWEW